MSGLLSALVTNAISSCIDKKLTTWKEHHITKRFIRDLENWTYSFEKENEGTVLSSDRFYEYIDNYRIIQQIFDFIFSPESNSMVEEEFTSILKNKITTSMKENTNITPNDETAISRFINIIVEKTKKFLSEKIPLEDKKSNYDISQINKKLDILINRFDSSEIITKAATVSLKDHLSSQPSFFNNCKNLKLLFKCAIEHIAHYTKTDYNQIILMAKIKSHETGLVVFADNVSAMKQRYRLVVLDGLISESYATDKIIVVQNIANNKKYFNAVSETKSEIVIPIKMNNNIVGVINSESEELGYYSEEMIKNLCLLSKDFGVALHELNYKPNISLNELPYIHIK